MIALWHCVDILYIFGKVAECFSHKLLNGIQRHAIIRLPATLMICSIVTAPSSSSECVNNFETLL